MATTPVSLFASGSSRHASVAASAPGSGRSMSAPSCLRQTRARLTAAAATRPPLSRPPLLLPLPARPLRNSSAAAPAATPASGGGDKPTNNLEALVKLDTAASHLSGGDGVASLGPAIASTSSTSSSPATSSSSASSSSSSSEARFAGIRTLSDLPSYPKDFVLRRLVVFVGIVVGYACYYLTRNSLTYAAPVMVADAALGMDITQVGTLTSLFPIAYGMSKFVSGVLGARSSPRLMLAGGLMATAAVNIAFGAGTGMAWFCTFWALNGILQGFGGPCCARILTSWFATKERGTYWGMWNIAHNLGGFGAPVLAGSAARAFGWKWGMWAPGIVGLAVGVLLLLGVRDSPEACGYPPIEEVKPAKKKKVEEKAAAASGAAGAAEKPSLLELLLTNVLKNPYIWGMALTYFFIYVVRQGVTSWFVFYLIKAKGVADAGSAAFRVSGLELGGLFGSLLAGRLSDAMIARDPKAGSVGKRVQVVMAYTVGVAASLAAFWAVPSSAAALQWACVFAIGFFLYGPQMLIGLCGAELVGPESVGASEGFLGWVAYLGAANAGVPLSLIVKNYGWGAYFSALLCACAGALLLLAPMVGLRSHVQREADEEKKLA